MGPSHRRGTTSVRPSAGRPWRWASPFVLLVLLAAVLLVAGGASRGDVLGQVVVRGVAWLTLVGAALFGPRPALRSVRPVLLILLGALAVALAQLVPLPPAVWQALPGRGLLMEAAQLSDQPQPWRALSIVPGATFNAASSLVVPFATLLLLAGLSERERRWVPGLVLALVTAATLVALLQLTGADFDNPFINDSVGQISGSFANRNHFALLLALGCALAPVWAFLPDRRPPWRGPVALGLMAIFTLVLLATGSRAGLLLGLIALVAGLLLAKDQVTAALGRYPRWTLVALLGGAALVIAGVVVLGIATDRAVAVTRLLADDGGTDMRRRALPVVVGMIREYFPAGIGMGGFDPLFRMHEPMALLKLTFFNHAHDDLLEVVLDAGLPGVVLLLASAWWWARASIRAWRGGPGERALQARLGSVMVLLVVIASVFDYPARTPMIMALAVVAAVWLNGAARAPGRLPLPKNAVAL